MSPTEVERYSVDRAHIATHVVLSSGQNGVDNSETASCVHAF